MKRIFAAITATLMVLALAGTAIAAQPAAPGKNPLTCFAGTAAACTSNGKTATINTHNGGTGVYLPGYNTSFYGVRTALVTKLSNTVAGDPLGIDPRWSIPIDDTALNLDPDGDGRSGPGYTDYFLYVSLADCNNGAGLIDVINDTTCTINSGLDGATYPNWSAFVTANPNTYIALNDYFAFIIADLSGAPGVWTISNVQVGKPGK